MRLLAPALILLAIASPVLAQEMVLTGVVPTRDRGLPVPNASVSIESLNLSTTTDSSGRYTLTLPAGTPTDKLLEVKVVATGLLPRTWSFRPASGTLTHDFSLTLTFSEEITV